MTSAPSRSATARTEASTAPSGKSAYFSTSSVMRSMSARPSGIRLTCPALIDRRNAASARVPFSRSSRKQTSVRTG
jgi:hypothetical protein